MIFGILIGIAIGFFAGVSVVRWSIKHSVKQFIYKSGKVVDVR